MQTLTKSKYLIGLQCPKYLWTIFHEKEKIPEANLADEFKFREGTEVGILAKKLFSNGIDIKAEDFKKNLEDTEEALKEKKPLFEAGFLFENLFSRADILVPEGNKWDIIEVKSGTKVKDVNIHDVAFQKYVYEKKGLKIGKCFLMHLNNEYVRKGELELDKLFVKEDISDKVDEYIHGIEDRIKIMNEIIEKEKCPEIPVGMQCNAPYTCPINCMKTLPENHVFCLYRGGKLSCELYDMGVEAISDIPEDIKLNVKQQIQRKNEVFVDKEKIKEFLDSLKEPCYYLDFETFSNAIPMFDGLKCYSQVPFQYSLHVNGEHYEFLYDGNEDPRKEFLLSLKKVLGSEGSVVVYNQSFEISRLKELGEMFGEEEWVNSVIKRVVDLLVVFRNFYYYNPKQEGSASIKKVLPALVGKSYKGMEIDNGGDVSVKFYNMAYLDGEDVREALLKYCELDTLAEVMIVEKLKEIV